MYTIDQTAEKLGIKVSTLRYYEAVMLLNKRIGLVVLAILIGSMVTGCQSRMKPGDTTGIITQETAVVENQLSNGILIAYMPDTAQALEVGGEEGQSDNTASPIIVYPDVIPLLFSYSMILLHPKKTNTKGVTQNYETKKKGNSSIRNSGSIDHGCCVHFHGCMAAGR